MTDAEMRKAFDAAMAPDFAGDRRREDWRLYRPTVAQMRAELADLPEDPETEARGRWEDECALREDRDPLLDDRPHPGGPRWEQLLSGEAEL